MASRHRVRADSNLLHKSVKIAYITHTILLQTSSTLKCSPSPFTALHCLAKTSLYNLQMSKSSAPPPTLSVLTGISFSRNSEPFSKIKSKKETLTGRESLDWVEILEDFPTRKRQREREREEKAKRRRLGRATIMGLETKLTCCQVFVGRSSLLCPFFVQWWSYNSAHVLFFGEVETLEFFLEFLN